MATQWGAAGKGSFNRKKESVMPNQNKDTTLNRIRLAIAGVQKHLASTPTVVLDGVSTPIANVLATLNGATTAIDGATTAEKAFHDAVAAQNAAVAAAVALLTDLKVLVTNQFGEKGAATADFGFAPATRKEPDAATKAAAVEKRAATRAARGTRGPRAKQAIKGQVPATPATPAKA
jgi:hypothetical protein